METEGLTETKPVQVQDVARFVLEYGGIMSTMKLQKMVYFCQCYALGWTGNPLFSEDLKAWTHGPVVVELFNQHKGKFEVSHEDIEGDADALDEEQQAICKAVVDAYNGLTGWELRNVSLEKSPWSKFFSESHERHNTTITHRAMQAFFANH